VHDFDYRVGNPKKEADQRFFSNMHILLDNKWERMPAWKRCLLGPTRPVVAHTIFLYYIAVKNLGGYAYENAQTGI
jgi:hypothetical protein